MISFTWYLDLFINVFMTMHELPMSERVLKENIIHYGLWNASKKPMMWSYLKPLHEEMKQLEDWVIMEDVVVTNSKWELQFLIAFVICPQDVL